MITLFRVLYTLLLLWLGSFSQGLDYVDYEASIDYKNYSNHIDELSDDSSFIGFVNFQNRLRPIEGVTPLKYETLSSVKILEVIKGKEEVSTVLLVIEPYYLEANTLYAIAGYRGMQENQDYLLFMNDYTVEGQTIYRITGIYQGKIPLSALEAHLGEVDYEIADYKTSRFKLHMVDMNRFLRWINENDKYK